MQSLIAASTKPLAALSLAALFAVSLAPAANAWFLPRSVDYDRAPLVAEVPADYDAVETPYHRCFGRASGTASHACGTASGGPSGGLL